MSETLITLLQIPIIIGMLIWFGFIFFKIKRKRKSFYDQFKKRRHF